MWVLIWSFYSIMGSYPMATSAHEFTTEQRCREAASAVIRQSQEMREYYVRATYSCVKK